MKQAIGRDRRAFAETGMVKGKGVDCLLCHISFDPMLVWQVIGRLVLIYPQTIPVSQFGMQNRAGGGLS